MGLADHRDAPRRGAGRLMRFLEDIEIGQRREEDRSPSPPTESRNSQGNSIRSAFISMKKRGGNRCSAGWLRPAGTSRRFA
jgi:hypothetical protein